MSTASLAFPRLRLPFFFRGDAVDPNLRSALDDADLAAFRLITRVKYVAMAAILVYILATAPVREVLWPILATVLLVASGAAHYRLEASPLRAPWLRYAFITFDILVVTLAILVPNPTLPATEWPPQIMYRFESSVYYFVFIAIAGLTYSPRFVLWAGFVSALCWGVGGLVMILLPGSVSVLDLPDLGTATMLERLELLLHRNYVPISNITQSMTIFLIVAAIGSIAVWRTKRLINRQLGAERERANLSRYFSPSMVDELAHMDDPLGAVRSQNAAVLFTDIKGFTRIAEMMKPEATIDLLREFHRRMAAAVFACGGTLDKYMGDGLMATFGTPHTSPDDARNAIRCARGMIAAIAEWNRHRGAVGDAPVEIGVGIHYGPVVLGDIGDERRLEFAVIGDTVNAASRLETLTREFGVSAVLSAEVVKAAGGEHGLAALDAPLRSIGDARIRGRDAPLAVYAID